MYDDFDLEADIASCKFFFQQQVASTIFMTSYCTLFKTDVVLRVKPTHRTTKLA